MANDHLPGGGKFGERRVLSFCSERREKLLMLTVLMCCVVTDFVYMYINTVVLFILGE